MKFATRLTALLGLGLISACSPAPQPEVAPPASYERPAETYAPAPAVPADDTPKPAPPTAAGPSSLGSANQAERPKAAGERELTDLPSAERALADAKAELDELVMSSPSAQRSQSEADAAVEKKREQKGSGRGAPANEPAPARVSARAQCEQTCRAFSSLARAANAVCRLDGPGGSHCTRAKRILLDSEQRVARCACAASED